MVLKAGAEMHQVGSREGSNVFESQLEVTLMYRGGQQPWMPALSAGEGTLKVWCGSSPVEGKRDRFKWCQFLQEYGGLV